MQTLIRSVLGIAIAALPCAVHADCSATGCYSVYVEQLMPTANNGIWIQTSGNEQLANCTPDSGVLLYLPASTAKEVYATLLAAQLADKLVGITINQGTHPCTVSYVYINRQ